MMMNEPSSGRAGADYSFYDLVRKGILISLPVIIYLSLIYFTISLLYRLLTPVSTMISIGSDEISWFTHLISLVLLILIFVFVGYLTRYRSLSRMADSMENRFLVKAPLYMTVRDMVQHFSGLKKMPFSQVVLVDPYGNGIKLTGFVSEEITPELYTIFVPTAPNPLNGNIYHVPKASLTFLNISPEIAMRSIVSMGNGSSSLFPDQTRPHSSEVHTPSSTSPTEEIMGV